MKSKLAFNTAWMAFGQGTYAACQWAILIVLARLQGAELVGEYALALAITAPVMIFTQLQMRYVFVTDVSNQYKFREYLFARLATTSLGCLLILSIASLGGFPRDVMAVILAVGIAKAFENLSDLFYGLAQRHERLDLVGLSLALRGGLGLASLTAGLYLGDRLVVGVLAMAASWALVFAAFDCRVTKPWRPSAAGSRLAWRDWYRTIDLAKLGLPLGVALMLISLNTNVPRYFLAGHAGELALGAFAAMAYFVIVGDLVVNALGQAASARLAVHFAAGEIAAFRRLLGYMVLGSVILGGAGMLIVLIVGSAILQVVYGADFAQYAGVFVWVMFAGAVGYLASPLGYGLTATRWFRVQPLMLGSVVIANVIGCYLLVPSLGLKGAVWAWTGSRIFQLVLFGWALSRRLGRKTHPSSRHTI